MKKLERCGSTTGSKLTGRRRLVGGCFGKRNNLYIPKLFFIYNLKKPADFSCSRHNMFGVRCAVSECHIDYTCVRSIWNVHYTKRTYALTFPPINQLREPFTLKLKCSGVYFHVIQASNTFNEPNGYIQNTKFEICIENTASYSRYVPNYCRIKKRNHSDRIQKLLTQSMRQK